MDTLLNRMLEVMIIIFGGISLYIIIQTDSDLWKLFVIPFGFVLAIRLINNNNNNNDHE
jgi:hypothetical protein